MEVFCLPAQDPPASPPRPPRRTALTSPHPPRPAAEIPWTGTRRARSVRDEVAPPASSSRSISRTGISAWPTPTASRGKHGGRPARPSGRVAFWFLDVDAAGRGLPAVPPGLRLGDVPAWRLLDLMARATAGARVTRTGSPALVIRQSVLEIRVARVPIAGWERTGAVSDLDEMAEPVARLVAVGLVTMVTFEDRHRVDAHGRARARQVAASVQVPNSSSVSGLPRGVRDQEPVLPDRPERSVAEMVRFNRAGTAIADDAGLARHDVRTGRAQPWPMAYPSGLVTVTHISVRGLAAAAAAS